MYIGKLNFKKALVISALWHFLVGVAVVIVINPAGFSTSKFSTISFLGSILQEAQMQKGKPVAGAAPTQYMTQADIDKLNKFLDRSNIKINTPPRLLSPRLLSMPKESGYKISFRQILSDYKEEPFKIYSILGEPRYKLIAVSFEGEIKDREIIYTPQALSDYIWESPHGFIIEPPAELTIEVDIIVSEEGKIETAQTLKPATIPELDSKVKAYIKKWLFVPLPASFKQKTQAGRAIIRFNRLR